MMTRDGPIQRYISHITTGTRLYICIGLTIMVIFNVIAVVFVWGGLRNEVVWMDAIIMMSRMTLVSITLFFIFSFFEIEINELHRELGIHRRKEDIKKEVEE